MLKLTDLSPRWCSDPERQGMGMSFLCPICKEQRLLVWFKNPIDGGEPTKHRRVHWQREGDSFENMTLNPSLDYSGGNPCSRGGDNHFHGWIKNGEVEVLE